MSAFGDTHTHPYIDSPGPIHLRRDPVRRDTRPRDFRAAEGIALAVMIGLCGAIWAYVLALWMVG